MDLFQYRSDQYEVFYHKRRRILYLYFPRVRLFTTFDIQRHCTCSQQVVIHWWWLLLFHFSSPSTIVFRCVISPHRLSLISLMITSSVSFFFTWFFNESFEVCRIQVLTSKLFLLTSSVSFFFTWFFNEKGLQQPKTFNESWLTCNIIWNCYQVVDHRRSSFVAPFGRSAFFLSFFLDR